MNFAGIILILAAVMACSPQNSHFKVNSDLKSHAPGAVYGKTDDRKEFFEVTNPLWIEKSRATVAIFSSNSLIETRPGVFEQDPNEVYGKYFKLCKDERFYNQPSGAYCSGVLIAKNLVLTAAHCFKEKADCDEAQFIFDYKYTAKNQIQSSYHQENIYACKKVVQSERRANGAVDYAIVELDRNVEDRKHIELPKACNIQEGDAVTTLGHPSGLPMKVISGGSIMKIFDHDFRADLDTFSGSSGGPVFSDATGELIGLLVGGTRDFYTDNRSGGCQRPRPCTTISCGGGEQITRIDQVLFQSETVNTAK